ncbi:MAG: hypothetical protein RL228_1431 [Actinomycetota bacterium]
MASLLVLDLKGDAMTTILAEAAEAANVIPGEPWMYGLAGFGTLVLLVYIVTRFNPNR